MNHVTLIHSESVLFTLIPIALVSIIIPLLGRTRQGVLFGVNVPLDFAGSAVGRASLRRYRMRSAALVLMAFLGASACLFFGSALTVNAITLATILIEFGGSAFLLLQEHRALRPYGISVPVTRTAELKPHSSLGPILAIAAAEIPLAIEALWLRLHWNLIPSKWPIHWNAAGVANGWGTRTPGGVFGHLFVGAGILLVFVLIASFTTRGAGTQARQRARAAAPMAAIAWVMSAVFCFVGLLPIKHDMSANSIVLLAVAQTLVTFAVVIWLLLRSNTMPGTLAAEPYDGTPESGWRAGGFIYFNPTDAALLVPKRYGWGWTLNFARPSAWFVLGAVLLLPIITMAVPILLH